MKAVYSYHVKKTIEFLWQEYDLSIQFNYNDDFSSFILGFYRRRYFNKIKMQEDIFVLKKNIEQSFKGEQKDFAILFVLFHEVGHFIIEKTKYEQKEEYANFIAYEILKQILSKRRFFSNVTTLLSLTAETEKDYIPLRTRKSLKEKIQVYVYRYEKFLKKEKKIGELL